MAAISAWWCASAFAETQFEKDMKALRDQRDKGVSDATKALNAHYQQALEQVYRRAVAAKDPSAEAIKTELATLGPLRVDTPVGQEAPKPPQLLKSMVGKWKAVHIGNFRETWEFKDDGTCEITKGTAKTPDTKCTWSKVKETIEVKYPDGKIAALDLPVKNGKIQGSTPGGGGLWLTKD